MLAGAQTPALVMSGLMGSPGSALREELFPCPFAHWIVNSFKHALCPLGASFDERWGVKDGVAFACSLLDSGDCQPGLLSSLGW